MLTQKVAHGQLALVQRRELDGAAADQTADRAARGDRRHDTQCAGARLSPVGTASLATTTTSDLTTSESQVGAISACGAVSASPIAIVCVQHSERA